MKKVVHIITGLQKGGAETMLYNILKNGSRDKFKFTVISLIKGGYYNEKIKDLNIEVFDYEINSHPISSFLKIINHLKNADTVCCWMYHANLIGLISAKFAGVKNIIWGVRHSNLDKRRNKRSTLFINRICSFLSKYVNVITYNGEKAKIVHESMGYDKTRSVVLSNGCDVSIFKPVYNARAILCSELSINSNTKILLSVAKYTSQKDIPNFINALALLKKEFNEVVGVMCGNGIDINNNELVSLIQSKNLIINKDVYLLGIRHDIPLLMSACDLYILHSAGEAFPNTLIEAMACEANCVATDVGDVKYILNDDERIVKPSDYIMLSEVIKKVLLESSDIVEQKRKNNRDRIVKNYSIKNIVKDYENYY